MLKLKPTSTSTKNWRLLERLGQNPDLDPTEEPCGDLKPAGDAGTQSHGETCYQGA